MRGLMALALCEAAADLPVNPGNLDERTIRNAAETVLRLKGSGSPLFEVGPAPNDPRRRCPDISRARTLLRWAPEVGFEVGVQTILDDLASLLPLRPHAAGASAN